MQKQIINQKLFSQKNILKQIYIEVLYLQFIQNYKFILPINSRNSNTQKEYLVEDLSKAPEKEFFSLLDIF
jgi:hypothetical protein